MRQQTIAGESPREDYCKSFGLGVNLRADAATISAVHEPEGACPNDPKYGENGIKVDTCASINLNFVGKAGDKNGKPDVNKILAEYTAPLEQQCYPLGPEASSTPVTSESATPFNSVRPTSLETPSSSPAASTPLTKSSSAVPVSSTPYPHPFLHRKRRQPIQLNALITIAFIGAYPQYHVL
ncbi:hypothetical protein BDV23DRAFT_188921 [Aspergillus alliaceus]|uniref:Uncharacterized protein n=1 Tax=Petromyces alliaceus TaxID=209559 RepID=A0A5N7BSE3_PETAA|nr:hypothetical protein BDV23DRAFT_188921 [Aspergillus alliaceus]